MNISKQNNLFQNIVSFILSYLSTEAFAYVVGLGKSDGELFSMLDYGVNILYVIIFGLGVFIISRYIKLEDKKIKIASFISGIILSILTVWGAYSLFLNDIFISVKVVVTQIFLILGLNMILTPAVLEVFLLMKKFGEWYETRKENNLYSRKNNLLYFLIVWIVIFYVICQCF